MPPSSAASAGLSFSAPLPFPSPLCSSARPGPPGWSARGCARAPRGQHARRVGRDGRRRGELRLQLREALDELGRLPELSSLLEEECHLCRSALEATVLK